MPYDISIKANFEEPIQDMVRLKKALKLNIGVALDKVLGLAVEDLKSTLRTYVNETVKVPVQAAPEQESEVSANSNVSKSKADLIQFIFGADITKADFAQKSIKGNTTNPNVDIFTVKDKRIKIFQPISDSSSLSGELSRVKDRLLNGIIIDDLSGKIYKPDPVDVKGIKLECSTDTGTTLNSEKKFDAYKNSPKITRRGTTPDQRVAIVTLRQEDVSFMMRNALDVDAVVDRLMNGDFDTASGLLTKFNKNGEFSKAIEQVQNLKENKNLTPNIEAYNNILQLIKNLKVQKIITQDTIKYILFSNYDNETEEYKQFFDELKNNIYLWILASEDKWFAAIVQAVINVLKVYDPKASL